MFLDTAENLEIEAVLAKYRVPAILLHRPYPPIELPQVRSRLGGLPNLPEGTDWPYGRDYQGNAVPLHFLAQIDCAELPPIDARLPTTGMLFFFARDDEEQVWGYESDPHDDGRVIYAPHVSDVQGVRIAPTNLLPIGNRLAGFDPVTPDMAGPTVHFSWPLCCASF
jgi:uncharacterized protein YwqG